MELDIVPYSVGSESSLRCQRRTLGSSKEALMLETRGDLWKLHDFGLQLACVTTNGVMNKDGLAVMGAGCAKQAANRFPDMPKRLGNLLRLTGNHVYHFEDHNVLSFPVKHHWNEAADLDLIVRSCHELMVKLDKLAAPPSVQLCYLPRPGCGFGKLQWSDVRSAIAPLLDDRVIVVTF